MRILRVLVAVLLVAGVASCSKFSAYNGPEVTRIVVFKEARKMHLLNGQTVLRSYDIGLGFSPVGDKKISGDGKTPEGDYFIDRRNPNSEFYLSLGISYPDASDRAEARALGKSPGGDIFIHGRPWKYRKGGQDWTAGCIAVTNREVREIYSMIGKGTPIAIRP
ncbi:L,D-transpeptidase family protein [Pseudoprimorskyibacter insulae]|uniref:L,D-TPase catalytic domain-containing protein n=1 Tax=Pseudoprimorskyibacter insulae TaxID=1695997 RepID=A0A2R8AU18_9RHOB|nr:L,D-transpeptidase family protein [Pseudoprimorskyibacter insulae]SPF79359.1 hypothetical protein PRI8871_01154 [Pseudoprimorskyibacter insulae]